MSKFQFRPTLWPTLAALAGITITVALGNWQLGRGNEKAVLAERIQAANRDALIALPADEFRADDLVWRRVEARGRFESRYAVFIDNRVVNGVAGYHVVMPLRLANSERYVLVNRGWIAATESRSILPHLNTPPGVVTVIGLATIPSRRYLELSTKVAEGNVWQNLTLERYRAAVPIPIQPVVIQQENDPGDGLKREWGAPDFGVAKHYGYAFQWFALAAALLIYYVVSNARKRAP